MSRIVYCVIAVFLAIMPVSTFVEAQEKLTELYLSPDGSFSFRYLSEWTLVDYTVEIVLSNSEQTAFSSSALHLQAGEIQVRIISPAAVALYMVQNEALVGGRVELAAATLIEGYLAETNSASNQGQVDYEIIDGYESFIISDTDVTHHKATLLALELEEGMYAFVTVLCLASEWDLFEPNVMEITRTISYRFLEPISWPVTGLPLEKTFITDNGHLNLDYPSGWIVQPIGDSNIVFVLNSLWALVSLARDGFLEPGQFLGVLLSPSDVTTLMPGIELTSPTDVVTEFMSDMDGTFGAPEEIVLQGKPTTIVRGTIDTASDENLGHFIIAVEPQSGAFVVFSISTHPDNLLQFEQAFIEVAKTIEYD